MAISTMLFVDIFNIINGFGTNHRKWEQFSFMCISNSMIYVLLETKKSRI